MATTETTTVFDLACRDCGMIDFLHIESQGAIITRQGFAQVWILTKTPPTILIMYDPETYSTSNDMIELIPVEITYMEIAIIGDDIINGTGMEVLQQLTDLADQVEEAES